MSPKRAGLGNQQKRQGQGKGQGQGQGPQAQIRKLKRQVRRLQANKGKGNKDNGGSEG
jgi:hypothetical protein